MKCKAHNQGDRCRKQPGHEEADPVHEGQFTVWQENKFREEKFERMSARRNRVRNRFIDRFDPSAAGPKERPRYIRLLGNIMKELHA